MCWYIFCFVYSNLEIISSPDFLMAGSIWLLAMYLLNKMSLSSSKCCIEIVCFDFKLTVEAFVDFRKNFSSLITLVDCGIFYFLIGIMFSFFFFVYLWILMFSCILFVSERSSVFLILESGSLNIGIDFYFDEPAYFLLFFFIILKGFSLHDWVLRVRVVVFLFYI